MHALSDVGQQKAGNGYRRQNDGKFKFDRKLSKWYVGLYDYNEEL